MTTKEEQSALARSEALIKAIAKEKKETEDRQALQLHLRGEEIAAAEKATAKAEAKRAWTVEGGNATDFEHNWDKLYQDLIYNRTLERLMKKETKGVRPISL